MARRGRYGQLPSAAPSLTNTIISIARQMQAERESNLMDAWKNGGTFEGKPVTDNMVLDYWRGRLKDTDPKDPNYDTFKNTITQTEYAVAESKMSTWYAQSKGDAAADRRMAGFYSTWANKIPKESEFYRILQRDAAQFIRAAIAKEKALAGSSGGGGGGHGGSKAKGGLTKSQLKAKAYGDSQAATYVSHEQVGAFLTQTFTTIAKGRGLIGIGDSKDLTDFDPNDPQAMMDVLNGINKHPDAVVYVTAAGGVTGQAILDVLKQLDPHFDGKLTTSYYGNALTQQLAGQHLRLDLATSTNHKTDMNAIKKNISATTELGRESNAWSIETSYQTLRGNFLRTWLDPNATPDQKTGAWDIYSKGLTALATSTTHPPDQNTFTRLVAEVTGDGSVDSLAENFTGQNAADHSSVNGGNQGDIADTHASLQGFQAQQEAVATGQAVWAMGTTASDGSFHAGAGNEIGAALPADVQASSPEGSIQVWINQSNGPAIPVWVAGKAVTASVVDADGFKVGMTNPDSTKVATAYDVTIDGRTTRVYSYKAPSGLTMYTTDAPWGANVQSHDTGGSVQLTVRLSSVPDEATVGKNPNFTVNKNEKGDVTSITVDPGRLVLTETDPVRYNAGADPNTDSLSPSIAYHLASPESKSELAGLSHDAAFTHTVEMDLRLAAGARYDAASGTLVGGDPAIYNEGASQAGFSYQMNDPRTVGLGPAGGEVFFGRNNTRGAFEVAPAPTPSYPNIPTTATLGAGASLAPSATATLPSDAARGLGPFNGLADLFEPGTNRLRPNTEEPKDSLLLTLPSQLKVPTVPKPSTIAAKTIAPEPLPVAGPTPTPAVPVPPGPTDRLTPMPVTPLPTPAATPRATSGDVLAAGFTSPATPKPATTNTAPKPLAPRAGTNRPA